MPTRPLRADVGRARNGPPDEWPIVCPADANPARILPRSTRPHCRVDPARFGLPLPVHCRGSPLDYPRPVADPLQFPDKGRALRGRSGPACPNATPVVGPAMLAYVRVGVAIAAVFVTGQRGEEREDSAPVVPYPQHNGRSLLVACHRQSSRRFKVSGAIAALSRRAACAMAARRLRWQSWDSIDVNV